MKVLALLEQHSGGEHIATQHLFAALRQMQVIPEVKYLTSLAHTGMLWYLKWIITNVIRSARMCWQYRAVRTVYSTTFLGVTGAILLRPWTKQQVIFHYHGSRLPDLPDRTQPFLRRTTQWVKYQLSFHLHQFACSHIDVFFIPSRHAFSLLQLTFPNCRFKRILVLPNGVNLRKFTPVAAEEQERLRKRFHIPRSSFVCLLISRLNEEKRILETIQLIEALHRFSRQRVMLLLAFPLQGNDDRYAERIQQVLSQGEVPHRAVQGYPEIEKLYQMSDCVLSHSSREVFPLALLEAAACGIPYFAIPNGITEQYLSEIDPELILPNSDQAAVRQILSGTHRRKLSAKLRAFAEQHSWQAAAVIVHKTVSDLR
jgi:glycosyltransferase involved in cell wall biosynthesis